MFPEVTVIKSRWLTVPTYCFIFGPLFATTPWKCTHIIQTYWNWTNLMFETYTLHILASSKTLGTVWSLQFLLESLHSSESPCPKNLGQKKQQHLWLLKTQNLPLVTRLNIKKPKGRNFQRQRPKRCRSANLMERCTRQEEHAKWSRRNIKRDVSCWFLSWCSVYTRNLQLCLQYQPVRFKNWRKILEI